MDYQTSMVKYSKAIAVTAQEMVSQLILLHARYFVMDCHDNKCWEGVVAVFGNMCLGECLISQSSGLIAALNSMSSGILIIMPVWLFLFSSSYPQVHLNCRFLMFSSVHKCEMMSFEENAEN